MLVALEDPVACAIAAAIACPTLAAVAFATIAEMACAVEELTPVPVTVWLTGTSSATHVTWVCAVWSSSSMRQALSFLSGRTPRR
jgi:hypothetical protein